MSIINEDLSIPTIKNKQEEIMGTFNLSEKEFSLFLYYFENEPPLDGGDYEPVTVLKDIYKDMNEENSVVVSDRFFCGLEYARIGGFDLNE